VIRWLIALMVLCCDPLAIAYGFGTAINHRLRPSLVRSPFDTCRADASGATAPKGHQQTHALQQKRPRGPFRQLAKLM
jgi:hypothetical protein